MQGSGKLRLQTSLGTQFDQMDRITGAHEFGKSAGASYLKTKYWFAMNDHDAGGHAWGWTAARREKQAHAIRNWKPWLKSTGPVTAQGKVVVSRNADKPNSVRRQVATMIVELAAVMQQADEKQARRRR